MSALAFEGDLVRISFDAFTGDDYALFLRTKLLPERDVVFDRGTETYTVTTHARFAHLLGIDAPARTSRAWSPSSFTFDYQADVARQVVPANRFGAFWECGLGKTILGLECDLAWQARDGGKGLIMAPKGVLLEWLDHQKRFYPDRPLRRISSRADLLSWLSDGAEDTGLASVSLIADGRVPEFRHLQRFILDESSLLKTGGGVIKWNLIHSCRGIPCKLSLTATPAPNDTMEFASQLSFLEKLRNEEEILWTFFTRDDRGDWQVKPHAKEGFYRFLAGSTIYLRDPSVYGWKDNVSSVPEPTYIDHRIEPTREQLAFLHDVLAETGQGLLVSEARLGVKHRTQLCEAARGFIYSGRDARAVPSLKPGTVAALAREETASGRPTIIWTAFDEEERLICRELDGLGVRHELLAGWTSEDARESAISAFRSGALPCLVTKSPVLGFGRNLQECKAMIVSGFDDSNERLHQLVRRAVRYGQTESVRVHMPFVPELEGIVLDNVFAKRDRFEGDVREMERCYATAYRGLAHA